MEDNDDLDPEPKEPTGTFSGKAATRGNRRQRRRKGTKRKHAEDDSTQEERDYQILTLITTKVTETETELQPLNKLFQVLNDDKKRDRRGSKETIYLENNILKHGQYLNMLLDCGSPSTIVGVETFKQIRNQYTTMVQSSFEYSESNKTYAFGGGRQTRSLGKVKLPVYVIYENMQPHLLHVWVEILNQQRLPSYWVIGVSSKLKVHSDLVTIL